MFKHSTKVGLFQLSEVECGIAGVWQWYHPHCLHWCAQVGVQSALASQDWWLGEVCSSDAWVDVSRIRIADRDSCTSSRSRIVILYSNHTWPFVTWQGYHRLPPFGRFCFYWSVHAPCMINPIMKSLTFVHQDTSEASRAHQVAGEVWFGDWPWCNC